MNDLITDILGNVTSAAIIALVPWLWYQIFSDKPLTSIFTKVKTKRAEQATLKDLKKDINIKLPKQESSDIDLPPKKYYKFLTKPNNVDRFHEFQNDGSVALGWPLLGDLTNLTDSDEETQRSRLKDLISARHPGTKSVGLTAGYFVKLLSMKPGDILVIPHEQKLYIYQVNKTYYYDETKVKENTTHRVGIDVENGIEVDLAGTELSIAPKFKRAVHNQQTIISLQWYADEIEKIINSNFQ